MNIFWESNYMLVLILSANLMDCSPFSQCAYTGENTSAEHWCYLKYFHCVMYPSGWKRESFITPTLEFLNLGTTDILDRIAVVESCPVHCRKYTIPVLHVLGTDSIPPSAPSAITTKMSPGQQNSSPGEPLVYMYKN